MIKIYDGELKKDDIEMRATYTKKLMELMKKDERVVALEADLMLSMGTGTVKEVFPERVINCGIMEAQMVGAASGMSIAGKLPFLHTFTAFASRRCLDQLFMSSLYQKNAIKVIASDSGITAVHNGGTHMSFEDMGIIRGLAHSIVLEVTDSVMFSNILEQVYDKDKFYWIRTMRKQAYTIYEEGSEFEIGKGVVLKEGSDVTIIANGIMVKEAKEAAEMLGKEGIKATVIDMFTLKPIDKDLIIEYAKKTKKIVTCENHNILNGLGSAVSEVLSENYPVKLLRIGIDEEYGQVGTLEYLMEYYKLRSVDIKEKVLEFLK